MAQQFVKVTPPETEPALPQESLIEPEFADHYQAWKDNPTPTTMGGMIKAVNPVIESAVKTYGRPSPTLRSRAKVISADAINKYDPSKGKLRTHLMYHLQGLRRYSTREQQVIRLPERVSLDLYRIREAENELKDTLGRDPSVAELADRTGLSKRRIGYVRKAQPGMAEGSLAPVGEPGEEQAQLGPAVQSASGEEAWQNFVYHDLGPMDQLIMEHTLGLYGKPILPKKEIARKAGITPGAVSQRAAKIQAQLNRQEELGFEV